MCVYVDNILTTLVFLQFSTVSPICAGPFLHLHLFLFVFVFVYIDLTEFEVGRWRKAVKDCLVCGAGSRGFGAIDLAQVMDD